MLTLAHYGCGRPNQLSWVFGRDGVLGKEFKRNEVVILEKQDIRDMSLAGSIGWRSLRDK